MQLDPKASAAGVRLIAHDELSSTNTEALSLAHHGEWGPTWITAARQTRGRGRLGRVWISEAGNLFASLLLTDMPPVRHRPELAFVAALAVFDAVSECAIQLRPVLSIKWPNDLLIAGAKFAGILVEADGDKAVAIGIGVNCTSHPNETNYPATNLSAAGACVSAEKLFAILSVRMMERLVQWNGGNNFSAIRSDWLARAAGLGADVRLQVVGEEYRGTFETVDENGRLVLRLREGGCKTVAAGDVLELRAPPRAPSCGGC